MSKSYVHKLCPKLTPISDIQKCGLKVTSKSDVQKWCPKVMWYFNNRSIITQQLFIIHHQLAWIEGVPSSQASILVWNISLMALRVISSELINWKAGFRTAPATTVQVVCTSRVLFYGRYYLTFMTEGKSWSLGTNTVQPSLVKTTLDQS